METAQADRSPDRSLYLTDKGQGVLARVMAVGAKHEVDLCRGLTEVERGHLIVLLSRVAAEQGLAEGVHPGVAESDDRNLLPEAIRAPEGSS